MNPQTDRPTHTFVKQFPLSATQKEIQILVALNPNCAAAFNLISVVRIKELPELEQMRCALRQVVQRHESLRAIIDVTQMEQGVLATYEPELPLVDFSRYESAGQEALQWLKHERVRSFDPQDRPMWRASILKTSSQTHYLVVTAHHLILDGWSFHVFLGEIAAYYLAGREVTSLFENPPLQFQAFCQQLEQRQAVADLESYRTYWLDQIGDSTLPILELPTDYPRPHSMTYHSASYTTVLTSSLRAALQNLASNHNCTLFMVLLAGYCTLLHRLSNQDKFMLGMDTAGRFSKDAQTVIGNCASLQPLVSDITGNPTVTSYLARVRQKVVESLSRQDYGLTALFSALKMTADPMQPIRINTTFNMQNMPRSSDLFEPAFDLQAQTMAYSLFDLSVEATDSGETIRLEFVYNQALFEETRIAQMAIYFLNLLTSMTVMPQTPLYQLPFLPEAEKQMLLVTWNHAGQATPPTQNFQYHFAAQVAQTPDRLAVTTGNTALTYAQLDSKSNQVAHLLRAQGDGEGALTALLAERDCDYLAAMLGIFKANQVYLPLDPRDPNHRLGWMLEQSGAKTILTSGNFLPLLAEVVAAMKTPHKPTILTLAAGLHAASPSSAIPLKPYAPQQPAYVIYTSGSTGMPKGALVGQAGMINHLQAKIALLALNAQDVVAQAASQCFDISIWQFLAPLLVGGRVHILDDMATHDAERLLPQIDRAKITIFQTVPSMLQAVLKDKRLYRASRPRLTQLRWLIVTGEALPAPLCRRWISHYPRIPLLNAYGPTECADDVTHHPIHWPPSKATVHVPIGRPINGANLYVLDAWRQPVPMGTIGELYIGGACVGLGYLNDPQRTTAAFVPDPFNPTNGAQLYRSGDLVKYLPNGDLVFIGRCDQQAKVNGVRIEPGEVEQALLQHPAIDDCMVIACKKAGESAFLAAYIVVRRGSPPFRGELLSFLRLRLPQYMIPAMFTVLDAIPLTPNGKVDRTSLPVPLRQQVAQRENGVAPRTAVEQTICAIWADTLKQTHIGIYDDLFDIGGRSLDAIRITAQINQTFRTAMPVSQIYREPTVHGIAQYLARMQRNKRLSSVTFA